MSVLAAAAMLSACSTTEEKALGNVVRAGGSWGVTVYSGAVSRKFRVIKKMRERRRQIAGPNYYDGLSGTAWMSQQAKDLGADTTSSRVF